MGTSLSELKTGREKLEIINQVLSRITSISQAIDNTRLDEIIGLKQSCEALKNECLNFKNDITSKEDEILIQYNDVNNKYEKINEKYQDINTKFDYIQQAYEDFSLNEEELKNIKDFLSTHQEDFDKLKQDIQKYETIKFDLENYMNTIDQNKDFVEEYFNLNTKIKQDILIELDHALEIVENLHLNTDELKEIKPELMDIKKEVKDLANEAKLVVSQASEILKNKINTIFFENQRLNQEMIEGIKKLQTIHSDILTKHEYIASAYELLLQSKQNLEDLKELIALYKEFEQDVSSYSQIIKDFKIQIDNLEQDLNAKSENLHASLENKQEEILKHLNELKNEVLISFDELVAKYEGYKTHLEQSYDRFNQRALIANEDLGLLAEVAKKELGNDKLIYESELKALRDEIIASMNTISKDVTQQKDIALVVFDNKKQELTTFVDTSKAMLDNLNHIFNANYQTKKNELSIFIQDNIKLIHQNKEQSLNELEDKKELNKEELEVKKDECIEQMNTQAKFYDIGLIKNNLSYILALIENDESKIKALLQNLSQKEEELANLEDQIDEVLKNDETLQSKKEELENVKNQINEALEDEDISELNSLKQSLEEEITHLEQELSSDLILKKEALEQEITNIEAKLKPVKLINQKTLNEAFNTINDTLENNMSDIHKLLEDKISINEDEVINSNKTFNQEITFKSAPISLANPTQDNQLTCKTYVDEALSTKVSKNENESLMGDKTFNGTTTLNGTLNANGAINLKGNTVFNAVPTCNINPSTSTHLANKSYVDFGGGIKNLGTLGSTNLDLSQAQHFILTANANTQIGVSNWAGAGKSGTITINNCQNVVAFNAPFKFRIAQSGFSGTETFAYFCIASNNIRLVRT